MRFDLAPQLLGLFEVGLLQGDLASLPVPDEPVQGRRSLLQPPAGAPRPSEERPARENRPRGGPRAGAPAACGTPAARQPWPQEVLRRDFSIVDLERLGRASSFTSGSGAPTRHNRQSQEQTKDPPLKRGSGLPTRRCERGLPMTSKSLPSSQGTSTAIQLTTSAFDFGGGRQFKSCFEKENCCSTSLIATFNKQRQTPVRNLAQKDQTGKPREQFFPPTLLQTAWYCVRALWHREECVKQLLTSAGNCCWSCTRCRHSPLDLNTVAWCSKV